jgi:hypothetical protein
LLDRREVSGKELAFFVAAIRLHRRGRLLHPGIRANQNNSFEFAGAQMKSQFADEANYQLPLRFGLTSIIGCSPSADVAKIAVIAPTQWFVCL